MHSKVFFFYETRKNGAREARVIFSAERGGTPFPGLDGGTPARMRAQYLLKQAIAPIFSSSF